MRKTLGWCVVLTCTAMLVGPETAYAQRQAGAFRTSTDGAKSSFNFTFGRFYPRPEEGRVDDDVLNGNRSFPQFLDFDIDDFRSTTFGVELLFPVGDYVEMGPGLFYMQRTVPTNYSLLLDDNLDEIEQDLSLRVIPLSFTVRVVPVPPSSPVQPYIGGGFGLFNWRYRESGSFVDFGDDPFDGDCTDDFDNCRVFETDPDEPFEASGWDFGPVFVGGVRVVGDAFSVGGELRWQRVEGDVPSDTFFGSKIDLGGWTFQGTIGVRF